jgi:hypothetical protein
MTVWIRDLLPLSRVSLIRYDDVPHTLDSRAHRGGQRALGDQRINQSAWAAGLTHPAANPQGYDTLPTAFFVRDRTGSILPVNGIAAHGRSTFDSGPSRNNSRCPDRHSSCSIARSNGEPAIGERERRPLPRRAI